jgi:MerR family transcriptional regulator/heat shock protein HspR
MPGSRDTGRTTSVSVGRGVSGSPIDELGVYVISVAAQLAGVHPQTLRIYERRGLLNPKRTSGNSRRYSQRDVDRLRRIQQLTQDEGVNLAGVRMIMELERQLDRIRDEMETLRQRVDQVTAEMNVRCERERRPEWGVLVRLDDVRNIFDATQGRR